MLIFNTLSITFKHQEAGGGGDHLSLQSSLDKRFLVTQDVIFDCSH